MLNKSLETVFIHNVYLDHMDLAHRSIDVLEMQAQKALPESISCKNRHKLGHTYISQPHTNHT